MILYCGVPGAGKSTHRARHYPDLPVVQFDVMRRNRNLNRAVAVEHLFREGERHLASGTDFVVDGAHVRPRIRRRWLALAQHYGQPAHLVVLHAPLAACLARQAGRTAPCPRNVVVDYHSRWRNQLPILPTEGWTSVRHVNGAAPGGV